MVLSSFRNSNEMPRLQGHMSFWSFGVGFGLIHVSRDGVPLRNVPFNDAPNALLCRQALQAEQFSSHDSSIKNP